jgi:diguanylate cyclase (GGDEF)-like protein
VNRLLVIGIGSVAVCASYLAVAFGLAPDTSVGPLAFASIALPGAVTGVVMAWYVIWETRNVHRATDRSSELSAQLVRREIEIGRLATVDELTGLYTRRAFDDLVKIELARYKRHGHAASLLILEIDDDGTGDTAGQLSRGLLLAEVSGILKYALRSIDLGCRYTNDSLAVLLAETDAAQARVVAEKVQRAVATQEFRGAQRYDGSPNIRLSVSQGIAVLGPAATSHLDLTRAAERALIEARTAGRGELRVVEAAASPDAA